MAEFLNGILETVRINSEGIPITKNKFELKKCLDSIVDLNLAKAQQKGLDLQLVYDPRIPNYLIGDLRRVHRIALELITNALNFTEKGFVKIRVQLAQKHGQSNIIKLIVSDTGIGIPFDQQQTIFTKFKRLTPSCDGRYSGTGLGLSIVRQFIEDLKAEIYVQSEMDKSTTFTCIIPLRRALLEEKLGVQAVDLILPKNVVPIAKTQIQEQHLPQPKPEGLSRILLVEDNAIAAKVALHQLKSLDCDIDHAPDGQTAISLAAKHSYDLIFMDIGLPDISGIEVTKHIRLGESSIDNQVPIVALTAHVGGEDKERCLEAGMAAVLSKPLLKETANAILNTFIPSRQKSQAPASIT